MELFQCICDNERLHPRVNKRNESIFNLVEQHQRSRSSDPTPDENLEYTSPINTNDVKIATKQIQRKLELLKNLWGFVPRYEYSLDDQTGFPCLCSFTKKATDDMLSEYEERDEHRDHGVRDTPSDHGERDASSDPGDTYVPSDHGDRDVSSDHGERDSSSDHGGRHVPSDHKDRGASSDPGDRDASSDPGDTDVPSDPLERDASSDPGDRDVPSDHGDRDVSSDHDEIDVPTDQGDRDVPCDHGERDVSSDPRDREVPLYYLPLLKLSCNGLNAMSCLMYKLSTNLMEVFKVNQMAMKSSIDESWHRAQPRMSSEGENTFLMLQMSKYLRERGNLLDTLINDRLKRVQDTCLIMNLCVAAAIDFSGSMPMSLGEVVFVFYGYFVYIFELFEANIAKMCSEILKLNLKANCFLRLMDNFGNEDP